MPEYPTTPNFADSFERIPTKVVENAAEGSVWVAKQIANLIRAKQKKKEKVEMMKSSSIQKDFSAVPKNTLKLIEEAENN